MKELMRPLQGRTNLSGGGDAGRAGEPASPRADPGWAPGFQFVLGNIRLILMITKSISTEVYIPNR